MMTKGPSVLTRRLRKPAAATMLTFASVVIAALLDPSIARPTTQILASPKWSTTPHSAWIPNQVAEKFTASEESHMTTKAVIEGYFAGLKQKKGWDSFLAEDMVFTGFTSPVTQVRGKGPYLESTKRFYGGIVTFEVRDLLIVGDKACALTVYQLKRPGSPAFESNVAEVFRVRDGKIVSFEIFLTVRPSPSSEVISWHSLTIMGFTQMNGELQRRPRCTLTVAATEIPARPPNVWRLRCT